MRYFNPHRSRRLGCQLAALFAAREQINEDQVDHPFSREVMHASDHTLGESMPFAQLLRRFLADYSRGAGPHITAGFRDIHLKNRILNPIPDGFPTAIGNRDGLHYGLSQHSAVAECLKPLFQRFVLLDCR